MTIEFIIFLTCIGSGIVGILTGGYMFFVARGRGQCSVGSRFRKLLSKSRMTSDEANSRT